MGAYLSEPKTEKESESHENEFFRCGASQMQGWRTKQEDAHVVDVKYGKRYASAHSCFNSGLFGVFDGHGGPDVSAFAATRLVENYSAMGINADSKDEEFQQVILNLDQDIRKHFTKLAEENKDKKEEPNKLIEELSKQIQTADSVDPNSKQSCATLQRQLISQLRNVDSPQQKQQLMMKLFLLQQLQAKNGKKNMSDSMGCTCVTSLIIPTIKDNCIFYKVKATNSGDSRVVVWDSRKNKVFGTKDHKPNDPKEKQRIVSAGGEVREMSAGNNKVQYRVNGNLNLCRALGDFEYKQSTELDVRDQIITSNPDIYSWDLIQGDLVILACDGIFDVLTNEELISFIRQRLGKKSLSEISEECMDHCLSDDPKASFGIGADNMTLMILQLLDLQSNEKKQ